MIYARGRVSCSQLSQVSCNQLYNFILIGWLVKQLRTCIYNLLTSVMRGGYHFLEASAIKELCRSSCNSLILKHFSTLTKDIDNEDHSIPKRKMANAVNNITFTMSHLLSRSLHIFFGSFFLTVGCFQLKVCLGHWLFYHTKRPFLYLL